jgi:hypothetical protein
MAQAVAELVTYLALKYDPSGHAKSLPGGGSTPTVEVDYLIYEKLYQELRRTQWREQSQLLKRSLEKLKPDKPVPD